MDEVQLLIATALVSGAVGALGAALLTSIFARSREREAWRREQKLKTYAGFLDQFDTLRDQQQAEPVNFNYSWRMSKELGLLKMVGNEAASEAADEAASLSMVEMLRGKSTQTNKTWHQARSEFVAAARKDLGMGAIRPRERDGALIIPVKPMQPIDPWTGIELAKLDDATREKLEKDPLYLRQGLDALNKKQ